MRSLRSTVRIWLARSAEASACACSSASDLQPGGQHLHCAGLVLQLRALVLAGDDDAGGQVRDADRRIGGVDALAALARRPVDVDAQIGFVDLDLLDLLGFGVDQHACGRRVHAALRLGDRNALHPVHAAFELQPRPHTVGRVALAGDRQRGVLVAAEIRAGLVENGDVPAVPFGVADVHAGQVGGEQRRLLAALAGFHFEQDVVGVMRIPGRQHVGQLGVEFGDARLQFGHLGGEGLVLVGQFARGLEVTARRLQLAIGAHDGRDLREAATDLAGVARVGMQFRVGQLALELGVLDEQRVDLDVLWSCCILPYARRIPRNDTKPTPGLSRTMRDRAGAGDGS